MYETSIILDTVLSVCDLSANRADNAFLSLGLDSPFHCGSTSFSEKDVSYPNKETKQR